MLKKEVKDRAILVAAGNEFQKCGLTGAAMEVIAKAAEVSKATLYKYYPSKEKLFAALVRSLFERVKVDMSVEYSSNRSVRDLLQDTLKKKFQLMEDKNFVRMCRLVCAEQFKRDRPDQKLVKMYLESRTWMNTWLEAAQKDGKLKPDVSVIEMNDVFHFLIDGYVFWPVLLGLRKQFNEAEKEQLTEKVIGNFETLYGA